MKDLFFERSAITNNLTYLDYYNRIRKIASSRFIWENLPKSWDHQFLEYNLYTYGVIGCVNTNSYGNILARVTLHDYNIYNNPIRATPYVTSDVHDDEIQLTRIVYNGEIDDIDEDHDKIVLINNNYLRTPTAKTVELFCRRLYEVERTIDVNIKQQKTPMILTCTPKQRLTLKQLYMQYDGNEPFIFGDKKLMEENKMLTLDTKSPFLLDKLTAHKQQIWNELLTFLGLNNVNYEKKERLILDEANANNALIRLNLEDEFQSRKKCCDHINKYFGYNIQVKLNPIITNVGGMQNE